MNSQKHFGGRDSQIFLPGDGAGGSREESEGLPGGGSGGAGGME